MRETRETPLALRALQLLLDDARPEADVPWDVVESVPLLWVTGTGVSVEPARATQRKILSRFVPLMKPDALLFAGHSENFLYVSDALKLRGKTVYELDERKRA